MKKKDSPYFYTDDKEHIYKVNGNDKAGFVWVKDTNIITEQKGKYLNFPGVYFIYVSDELYYIGESYDIFSRLKDHLSSSSELFSATGINKNAISVIYIDTSGKNKLYRLAIEGAAYIIAEESDGNDLNPNNIPTYENTDTMITEYMTDVKKNTRKIKNNFNGVIYNLFLLDTIKEENNE